MYNLSAELSKNLNVYNRYYQSRAQVKTPQKIDFPMVQAAYLDTEKPVGSAKAEETTAAMETFGGEEPLSVTYRSPIPGDLDVLTLLNDRLKTQARRYPHPITNDMEVVG